MQNVYSVKFTHYVLLFSIIQCKQEKSGTLLHTVNVIGHHRVSSSMCT